MKEICIDGELYVRKKDVCVFLKGEDKYVKSHSQYSNATKDIMQEIIKEDGGLISKDNKFYFINSVEFSKKMDEKNLRESIFLKEAFKYGLIIKSTQGKFRHNTSIGGIKSLYIKLDISKFKQV